MFLFDSSDSRSYIAVMKGLIADLRHAVRLLGRNRVAILTAVASLAVGIGANTAIFSVASAMLLRPLPFANADRLVMLRSIDPSRVVNTGRASSADLRDWQTQARSFVAIAGYRFRYMDLLHDNQAGRLHGLFITPQFFDVLDVPLMGTTFRRDATYSSDIILGNDLWRRSFGGNPNLVGGSIDVNMINLDRIGPTPVRVNGVAQRDVHFPPLSADFYDDPSGIDDTVDFWQPYPLPPAAIIASRKDNDYDVIARLQPGVTVEAAQVEMDAITRNLAVAYPESNLNMQVRVVPLREHLLGKNRRVLALLIVCTICVLLLACANVASLLLAIAAGRQKEVAIRSALGASSVRLARQFLAESTVLAFVAALFGALLAAWGIHLLTPQIPEGVPLARTASINVTVLAFTALAACFTALLTGIIPALHMSQAAPGETLKLDSRTSSASRLRNRVVSGLVAAEVAVALVLLIATGLMLKSAKQLLSVDPGFDPHSLLTMTISLPNNKFEWKHNVVFSREVIDAVKALPRVTAVTVAQGVPMKPGTFWGNFEVEGQPSRRDEKPEARIRVVNPGYFHVMQIPLVSGREFELRDEVGNVGDLPYVIVNHTLASRYWPGEDAVGKRLLFMSGPATIIGVARDVKYMGLDSKPDPELYYPLGLYPQPHIILLVRASSNPSAIISDVRKRIVGVDKDAFVTDVKTMDQLIDETLAPRRFATTLLSTFGAVALLLSLTGIYGVISHMVTQRTREIGIRVALGAPAGKIITLMLQCGFLPASAGVAIGCLAAFSTTNLLSAMLFEVGALDPSVWLIVSTGMLAVACLASYLPARRACTIDPCISIKAE
jgi:putative ABC transport system permease protein